MTQKNKPPVDTAFQLLLPEFSTATKPALWLVDENIEAESIPAPVDGLTAITNRHDLFQALEKKGWSCEFNDYNIAQFSEQNIQTVLFRISKEKAQTHYFINQAASLLIGGGSMIFTGMKQEGIKGYIDRTEALINDSAERWKSDKQTWAASIHIQESIENKLDDKDYSTLRLKPEDSYFQFNSKPGVFGWDKIDQGSELLIDHLKELVPESVTFDKALDLGCGYGYLSLHTARLLGCKVFATDNNAAAISSCGANFEKQQISGRVVASNCGESINERFPLVVCNPPFHSGFATSGDLTDQFLESAARHLEPNGIAIFVTNLHIPTERKAAPYFAQCDTPVVTKHFKLIRLSKPNV